MTKSSIAFACLVLFAGVADAQSSVTVYGKIDLGLAYDSGNPVGKSVRIDSGISAGSRLGFKGVEDLGGGYNVSFQLETGYCADSAAGAPNFCTGSNQFMGRQAHGDIAGAFGRLSAGRQYSAAYLSLVNLDPFGSGYAGQVNNITDPSGIRLNNPVNYTTPVFHGVTATAEIALGEQTGNWKGGREIGGAMNYSQGPAYATLAVYSVENPNGVRRARSNYLLGGTYDLGVVKAHLMLQKSTGSPTGKPDIDTFDIMGGATVPLAGGSLLASYVHRDDRATTNRDASQIGVGYVYPLSKRTSLYTAFARINNSNGSTFTVGNATAVGTGNKAFNLGAVHNF